MNALLAACRPRQWVKNALVFVPLISSESFGSPGAVKRNAIAAAAFTLMSSAVYLLNDLSDRRVDGAHPVKKRRPIASGRLSTRAAAAAALVLAGGALLIAVTLPGAVWSVLTLYLVCNVAYSAGLRQQPVLDVLLISTGFVLRPVAGAWAIPVRVSAWLFVVSLLMSLSLALLKRRAELTGMEEQAVGHRPALVGYSLRFLDQLVAIVTGAGIISYALYTFQSEHSDALVATLPFFLYGVFRYLYLVYERGAGSEPEEIFLRDRPLQIGAGLYLAALITVLKMVAGILKFVLWEAAVWLAALRISRMTGPREGAGKWLVVLAIQVTLESSVAALLSFTGLNSETAYWVAAGAFLLLGFRERPGLPAVQHPRTFALMAALTAPLLFLAFRPVEEIDSINYLHYLIDWMANRTTPYTFATNYVAFWELSFLPVWTVTGLDLFFPLLALKAVLLMAFALWLVGREIGWDGPPLLWTIFGALAMRHYWVEASGVPTLKNDVLHGVGFVLLALIVLRAALRKLTATDIALLAFAVAFVNVKYTGIFLSGIAIVFLMLRGVRAWLPVAGLFLVTSGHYYVRSLLQHGSPFYPFQINLGPIHLPGTADLSYSSILYSLHDPRLWRALFVPAGGVSPVGLLFPVILAGTLGMAVWRCARAVSRRKFHPLDWVAAALLGGWLLYFRSVFSASGAPGDLAFILNGLNSIRYVDGVLAVSELFLAACLGARLAIPLIALNGASRLIILYVKVSPQYVALAVLVLILFWFVTRTRWSIAVTVALLFVACPLAVQRNRSNWTNYWNDLKPALEQARPAGLAELAVEDGGYFAGHVVAAGNPVAASVRALLPRDLDGIPPTERPEFLAVLVTPGSEVAGRWRDRYTKQVIGWGYLPYANGELGAVFHRNSH